MPARSKIIKFTVGTGPWLTLTLAHAGAETHRLALLADGDDWATPETVIDQFQGEAAGLFLGKKIPTLSDPSDTERIDYYDGYWYGQPPGFVGKTKASEKSVKIKGDPKKSRGK